MSRTKIERKEIYKRLRLAARLGTALVVALFSICILFISQVVVMMGDIYAFTLGWDEENATDFDIYLKGKIDGGGNNYVFGILWPYTIVIIYIFIFCFSFVAAYRFIIAEKFKKRIIIIWSIMFLIIFLYFIDMVLNANMAPNAFIRYFDRILFFPATIISMLEYYVIRIMYFYGMP